MSKPKAKGTKANPASSRVGFLFEAASLLAHQHSTASTMSQTTESNDAITQNPSSSTSIFQFQSRRLVSDLRAVSLKAQVRLTPAVKHSICRNCNTVLLEGSTCTKEIENKSKGGKKPWADIMVQKCNTCGATKRFPTSAARQKRRPQRMVKTNKALDGEAAKAD